MDPVTRSILEIKQSTIDRNREYDRRWAFYKGDMYTGHTGVEYARSNRLYKSMREVFNCVTQAVDVDARFVMQQDISVSSSKRKTWADRIREIWDYSNMQSQKYKLCRFGGNLGTAYLVVYELDHEPWSKIAVANSEDFQVIYDPHDQDRVDMAIQSYLFFDRDSQRSRRWDRIWDDEEIRTYIDDELQEDLSGPHAFGSVPVIPIKHIDIGEIDGLYTWHSVHRQIDAVNELGSFIVQIMLRYADPTVVVSSTTKPERLAKTQVGDVLYVGKDGDMRILEYTGNVLPQCIEFIREIKNDINDTLPELALARIKEIGQLSGYSVRMHLSDFVAKVNEIRGNYSDGMEWANSLALKVALSHAGPAEELTNTIEFQAILPEDELEKYKIHEKKRGLKIESRRGLLREEGLTEPEIRRKLEEIQGEVEEDVDAQHSRRVEQDAKALSETDIEV